MVVERQIWNAVEALMADAFSVGGDTVKKAAAVYSKGRGDLANKEWNEDSSRKQSKVSEEILQAAIEFLEPYYDKLQELSRQ